jgi:hypothetical protein
VEATRHTRDARPAAVTTGPVLLAHALVVAAVAAPAWYWAGGLIEVEALQFIRQYLDGRGLFQKIFDPYANDLGTYQARELSYLFDYLDARVFSFLLAREQAVFIPASAILASVLTVASFFAGIARYRGLPPLTAALVLLLYLTNYVHLVTMGMFYRSTKPLLAAVLMATTFAVLSVIERDGGGEGRRDSMRAPLAIFGLFSIMSLLDRQGFFYAFLGLIVLAFHAAIARGRRDVVVAAVAAVLASVLYNLLIAPFLVELANGYRPSFAYQRLPIASLLTDPRHVIRGAELLLQASAMLPGAMPSWAALGTIGLVAILAVRKRAAGALPMAVGREIGPERPVWTRPRVTAALVLVAVGHLVMFAIMVAHHPPLYEHPDHRLWYYPLPFQALLVTGLAVLLSYAMSGWGRVRRAVVNVLLVAGVVANVLQWDTYSRIQRGSGWFYVVYYQTRALKLSLTDGRQYLLLPGYADFYGYCLWISPAFRARAVRSGAILDDGEPR